MNLRNRIKLSAAIAVISAMGSSVFANEISFSFGHAVTTDAAGAGAPGVKAQFFNPLIGSTSLPGTALDSTGAALPGVTVSYTENSFGNNSASGLDDAGLFAGWVDQKDSGGPSTLSVTGIPYASYDVYIYMHNDTDGPNRTGSFTIGGVTHYVRGPGSADTTFKDPAQGGTYVLSNDLTQTTAAGTTAGDYTTFTGLTGNLSVSFGVGLSGDAAPRNKYVGLQIVQTPEPASLSLVALGSLGLLARKRRNGSQQ